MIWSGRLTWIINVTVVLLCPDSVWPTAECFIMTLGKICKLYTSWHDLCITGMVLPAWREFKYQGWYSIWMIIMTLLLRLQPWLVHFISEKYMYVSILLSDTDWSGKWVSAKVYGLVYFYWNPLSVGCSCMLMLLSFRFIVFLWIPATIRWITPY